MSAESDIIRCGMIMGAATMIDVSALRRYLADPDCALWPDYRGQIEKITGLAEELQRELKPSPEVSAPAVVERTPKGKLAVLHLGNERPEETAARLVGLASWELDARAAEQVKSGVFEPRTTQAMLHLVREAFAAIDESLRERIRSGETDDACIEAARDRRTAMDQLESEEQS